MYGIINLLLSFNFQWHVKFVHFFQIGRLYVWFKRIKSKENKGILYHCFVKGDCYHHCLRHLKCSFFTKVHHTPRLFGSLSGSTGQYWGVAAKSRGWGKKACACVSLELKGCGEWDSRAQSQCRRFLGTGHPCDSRGIRETPRSWHLSTSHMLTEFMKSFVFSRPMSRHHWSAALK